MTHPPTSADFSSLTSHPSLHEVPTPAMPAFHFTHKSLLASETLPSRCPSARNALAPETHYTGSSRHPPSGRGLLCPLPCCIPGPGTEPVPGRAPKCMSVKGAWHHYHAPPCAQGWRPRGSPLHLSVLLHLLTNPHFSSVINKTPGVPPILASRREA